MKKYNKILLVISIILCSVFLTMPKVLAEGVSVDIVSFARGAQTDLRASELLEARVTGYNGNVMELQYEWTTTQSTYLYLYYSHNMYRIMNTGGEVEISRNSPAVKRQGYAWAAIYTADTSMSDLLGTITVNVYDPNGNLLATDSHTGTRTQTGTNMFGRPTYTYSGFVEDNLNDDLESVAFGMFEGDSKNALSLLGEAGIVHIDCPKSTLTEGHVSSGNNYISMSDNKITALQPGSAISGGDAIVSLSVTKDYCKFHSYSSGDADVPVYVFKRPVPVAGATTITITAASTDDRVEYYIEGVKGVKQSDGTVIFTGLTPNTTYEIMAKGQVQDTKPVYAYVNATTLPTHTATINVYLDTLSATHIRKSIIDVLGNNAKVAIRKENPSEYIILTEAATGIYTTTNIDSGTYYPSYSIDGVNFIEQNREMVITSSDVSIDFHFYQVEYDLNGGTGNVSLTNNYIYGTNVNVTNSNITKEGYELAGFKDQDGNIYAAGSLLTSSIAKAYKLTALWTSVMDKVIVNVTVDHADSRGTGKATYNPNEILKVQLTHQLHSGEPYTDYIGKTQSYTLVQNDYVNDTFSYTFKTFEGLSSLYKYSANVTLDGYYVESKNVTETTTDGVTTYTVDVVLKYRPDLLDLNFSVVMKDGTPTSLKPVSAEVKITSWYENKWQVIPQHQSTTVTVPIDGNGTYTVWQWVDEQSKTPYYYRLEVISVELSDGTIVMLSDNDIYSYTVEVKDGGTPSGQQLNGVYGKENNGEYVQQGTLTAIIDVKTHTVTLNPNGGMFSDNSTNNVVIDELLTMPDISGYVPTKDGYTFDGWYLDNGTTINTGTTLNSDITLYAKWKEKLTISGQVAVAGTYELSGNTHTILDIDRIKSVIVLLQKVADGHFITVTHKTINLTYSGNIGYGTYSFTDIIDDGTAYRIAISNANYETLYQNEPNSLNNKNNFDIYNTNDYLALMGTTDISVATVNAYLHFVPETFELKYTIDATAIGEGFRPTLTEVLVLCDDGSNDSNPQNWAVISQMILNGNRVGQDTALVNGLGNNFYNVWKYKPDGISLYDYSVLLYKYVMGNGEKIEYNPAVVPFWAHYNGHARFDEVNNQTNELVITLTPHMYSVKFNVGFTETENDYVTGMDYYQTHHTWSYETDLSGYVPSRVGYTFLGWYDEDDNKVTVISADVARNVELTAKWTPEVYNITYILDGGNFEVTNVPNTYTINDQVTLPIPGKDGYIFMGWYSNANFSGTKVTEITKGSTGDKTFYALWEKDVVGGGTDGNEPDNIPDKFQKKVIFKIVNGTWDGTNNKDKIFYVTLTDEEGNWSITGTATIEIPTGMTPNYGYEGGSWDKIPTAIVSGTETVTYTYSYTKIADKEVTYNEDEKQDVPYGEYIKVDPNGGKWIHNNETYTTVQTFKIEEDMIINDATRTDYIFMGWNKTTGEGNIKYIFTAMWEKDVVGGGTDGNDKVFYVTLLDELGKWSITGKATIEIPTGMKANIGYENGSWDKIPSSQVSGIETIEFTYSFEEIPEIPNTIDTIYYWLITSGLSFITLVVTLIINKKRISQY